MTQFDELFADSFDGLLDSFGESVVFVPGVGQRRSIRAIVDRSPGSEYNIIVRVHNDATTGISSGELNEGADRMEVTERVGETEMASLPIHQLINAEGGVCVFEVK